MANKPQPLTVEQFLDDVKHHEMRILLDQGIYRHLHFGKPGCGNLSFSLVTWPGFLAMSGDMGEFIFERTDDMLRFFKRYPDGEAPHVDAKKVYVNEYYWGQKMRAGSSPRKEWDRDEFISKLVQEFREKYPTGTPGRWETWEVIRERLEYSDLDNEFQGQEFASSIQDPTDHTTVFEDFWDWDCTIPNSHYLWALHAISWGTERYWALKEEREPVA